MKSPTIDPAVVDVLRSEAAALSDRMIANRRRIHMFPELGLRLPVTEGVVVEELRRIGVDSVRTGNALSSVVADITGTARGNGRTTTVALRADMDALPLGEHNDLEFASKNNGCMHACGHDAHVSMLIGAAELLMARRASFAGTVRLLFQPGEEGFGGARIMIDEGALSGVDAAFALHVDPSMPLGALAIRNGTIMASADSFMVSFHGTGGHASMPHHTHDPIPAIGPFVDGLSHAAARETDPDDRVVLSVTQVRAGTANNVIPPVAECGGTIRALSKRGRAKAHAQLRRVAEGVAASRGLTATVSIHDGYPPTVNHERSVELVADAAARIGFDVHRIPSPVMGAEDFSYVLETVPGAFAFLGARTDGGGPLHSDLMKLDESVLERGAALHVAIAMSCLGAE